MSIEERFNAAVNVIRGLPKNGSYQPSHDMMLRFYAYFKQGTEGTCNSRRPAFWDIVGRAKYDAWRRLGEMPREKAMESYVDELRKIVETMSYTDNVADFYGSINQLNNVNVEDLQLVAPEAIKEVRSRPNSPFHSRETSPVRQIEIPNGYTYHNGHHTDTSDDDEYIDTVEDEVPIEHISRPRDRRMNYSQHNGDIHKKTLPMTEMTNKLNIDPSMLTHLVQITEKMKVDLQQVNNRMNLLEQKIARKQQKYPAWWPFENISPYWFSFTIVWPIAVALVFRAMHQNKLNRGVGKR